MRKIYFPKCKSIKNLKNLKYYLFMIKQYFFLALVISVELKMRNI